MARTRIAPRLGITLTGALLPLALLTACTSSDPEPTSTDSPTTQPEPTESQPTEPVEPTPPAAMNGNDEAAAKAFVEYYFELLQYAAASGDASPARKASLPLCRACDGFLMVVDRVYKLDGTVQGGDMVAMDTYARRSGSPTQGLTTFDSSLKLKVGRQEVSGTGDKSLDGVSPRSQVSIQAQLVHDRSGWRMSEWTQQ